MELDKKIEGVLFYKAAPMKRQAIAQFLNVSLNEVEEALTLLSQRLAAGATRLLVTAKDVQLVTAPELSETIEALRKDDLKKDIGKAGAETLAIILYRSPVSRTEIDQIRGVNSSFILRNLMVRGLIARTPHPRDARTFTYHATTDLLAHLGITKREELPDFSEVMNALDAFEENLAEEAQKEPSSVFES